MLDYTKFLIKNIAIADLMSNKALDFKGVFSASTGSVKEVQKLVAQYHHCEIIIYESEAVYFSGSIHKMWNSLNNVYAPNLIKKEYYKGFNGNQFTLIDILEVREHLCRLLNIGSYQMTFRNLEVGLNLSTLFNPQLFIKGLLYHNGKPFKTSHKDQYAQAEHQRYIVKIYNKGHQYGMSQNTLRVELKLTRADQINPLRIKTFADISSETLNNALGLILMRFDEVVYYDNTIDLKNLSGHQKQTLERYSNPRYWIDTLTPKTRDRHKKKLKEFIIKYSRNLHQQLRQEIQTKGVMICNQPEAQKCVIITKETEAENQESTTPIKGQSKNPKCVIITGSIIEVDITQDPFKSNPLKTPIKADKKTSSKREKKEPRKCLVTGLDISMQKDKSYLLSHTGLRHYYKNERQEFEKVKNRHLSRKWMYSNFEMQIIELAHNIRNRKNNQKIFREKIYTPNQIQLFEPMA
jgi:hypothetical protein